MAKKKKNFAYWPQAILALVAFSTLSLAAYFLFRSSGGDRPQLAAEKKVPITTLLSFKGKDVSLSDTLISPDKNLLIFWATWCGPCVEELKRMPTLLPKIKEKGYAPIFINYDYGENRIMADNFAKEFGIDSYFDLKGELLYSLGISSLPVSLIVDKSGKITRTLWGELGESKL